MSIDKIILEIEKIKGLMNLEKSKGGNLDKYKSKIEDLNKKLEVKLIQNDIQI